MPNWMPDRISKHMPRRMSDRMSTWICHTYFQMLCQKLCRNSVSGWGSLACFFSVCWRILCQTWRQPLDKTTAECRGMVFLAIERTSQRPNAKPTAHMFAARLMLWFWRLWILHRLSLVSLNTFYFDDIRLWSVCVYIINMILGKPSGNKITGH